MTQKGAHGDLRPGFSSEVNHRLQHNRSILIGSKLLVMARSFCSGLVDLLCSLGCKA